MLNYTAPHALHACHGSCAPTADDAGEALHYTPRHMFLYCGSPGAPTADDAGEALHYTPCHMFLYCGTPGAPTAEDAGSAARLLGLRWRWRAGETARRLSAGGTGAAHGRRVDLGGGRAEGARLVAPCQRPVAPRVRAAAAPRRGMHAAPERREGSSAAGTNRGVPGGEPAAQTACA